MTGNIGQIETFIVRYFNSHFLIHGRLSEQK